MFPLLLLRLVVELFMLPLPLVDNELPLLLVLLVLFIVLLLLLLVLLLFCAIDDDVMPVVSV